MVWYYGITQLYGPHYSLINEHILAVHLTELCKRFGPLYSHNCFAFESFYGGLLNCKSGTHQMQHQMLNINGYTNAIRFTGEALQIKNDTPIGSLLQDLGVPVVIMTERYKFINLFLIYF